MRAMAWMTTGVVTGLLCVAACGPANARKAAPDAPLAQTRSGTLAGERSGDVTVFRGIPYAAAPVGQRRWTAPAPVPAWQGTRQAIAFAPNCPQPAVPPPFGVEGAQSEDCLYLNVWTPKDPAPGGLPVFVWIHGGAFLIGAGSQPIYDGATLAGQGMVVVTLNYRLGALGFLNHRSLADQAGGSANFGLLDQIAALQWVRDNIAAFGGDPGNVTLAGESAGGVSVQALMAGPLARGLFHKAVIQSGGGLSGMVDARSEIALQAGDTWAASVGGKASISAAELRALPAEGLAQARFIAFPTIDGHVLERNPALTFVQGGQAQVPLLIGANSWEASLAVLDDNYARIVLAGEYEPLLASYRAGGLPEPAAREQLRTDLFFVQPARYLASLHARSQPTWLYHFDKIPASLRGKQPGAAHGGELAYLFATPASVFTTWDARDHAASREVTQRWARFAANGDPNRPGAPEWKSARDGQFLLLQSKLRMASPSPQDRHATEVIVRASQPWIGATASGSAGP